ncbi:MAG: Ribosomal RNA small subunit methyltransferase A [Planctomycetes bacterium]|nr:Ribosomal RNA small subunit methyltransferase A [Planctomycetota bacterium]
MTELPRTRGPLVSLLEARGLRLRRRDGQNFLVDAAVADAIADASGATGLDRVIEVGPGAGALTMPLLARAKSVLAVELDRGLHELLEGALGGDPRFTLVHGDALAGDVPDGLHPAIDAALRAPREAGARTLLVSNLPYSAGTEIVVRMLLHDAPPDRATLMLQEEVVRRMRAAPGSHDYGPLAVLVALTAGVSVVRRVAPSAFFPRPDVESVVFHVTPDPARRARPGVRRAVALARTAFMKRRKTLSNALEGAVDPAAAAAAGIDLRRRAEEIPPDRWLALGAECETG